MNQSGLSSLVQALLPFEVGNHGAGYGFAQTLILDASQLGCNRCTFGVVKGNGLGAFNVRRRLILHDKGMVRFVLATRNENLEFVDCLAEMLEELQLNKFATGVQLGSHDALVHVNYQLLSRTGCPGIFAVVVIASRGTRISRLQDEDVVGMREDIVVSPELHEGFPHGTHFLRPRELRELVHRTAHLGNRLRQSRPQRRHYAPLLEDADCETSFDLAFDEALPLVDFEDVALPLDVLLSAGAFSFT